MLSFTNNQLKALLLVSSMILIMVAILISFDNEADKIATSSSGSIEYDSSPQGGVYVEPVVKITTTTTKPAVTTTTVKEQPAKEVVNPKVEKPKPEAKKPKAKKKAKVKPKPTTTTTTPPKPKAQTKPKPKKKKTPKVTAVWEAEGSYVSVKHGNDSNPGTKDKPWKSLQFGIDQTQRGETLWVMNGNYTEHKDSSAHYVIKDKGEGTDWVRIKAAKGHTPKIVATETSGVEIIGNYIEFSGFHISGRGFQMNDYGYGIVAKDGHHFILNNNKIHDMPNGGIAGAKGSHYHIEGNEIWNNAWFNDDGGSGISLWRLKNLTDHDEGFSNKIINNSGYRNENFLPCNCVDYRGITDGNSIIVDQGNMNGYKGRTLIKGNTAQQNGGRGVQIFESSHVVIESNVLTNNAQTVSLMGERSEIGVYDSHDITIKNNRIKPSPGLEPISVAGDSSVNQFDNAFLN